MARPRLAEGRTTISCPSSSPASAGLASPKPSLSIEVTNNRLTAGVAFRICCCERLSGGQSVKLCPQSGPLLGDEAKSLGNLSQLGRGRAGLDKGLQGIIIRQRRGTACHDLLSPPPLLFLPLLWAWLWLSFLPWSFWLWSSLLVEPLWQPVSPALQTGSRIPYPASLASVRAACYVQNKARTGPASDEPPPVRMFTQDPSGGFCGLCQQINGTVNAHT